MQTDIDTEDLYFQDCVQRIINGIQFEACLRRPGSFTVVDLKRKLSMLLTMVLLALSSLI